MGHKGCIAYWKAAQQLMDCICIVDSLLITVCKLLLFCGRAYGPTGWCYMTENDSDHFDSVFVSQEWTISKYLAISTTQIYMSKSTKIELEWIYRQLTDLVLNKRERQRERHTSIQNKQHWPPTDKLIIKPSLQQLGTNLAATSNTIATTYGS